MESSAQGAGAAGEQATREFPSVGAAAGPPLDAAQPSGGDTFAQRPELFVGAAFVGGVVLAQLLKRVGR
jgi:hypothetical protein